jgi:outer membrane biosynthesis protein TonB
MSQLDGVRTYQIDGEARLAHRRRMRRAPSISGAVILSLAAGCGGSSPPPEEPQQVAIVELREPPKSAAVSEKEPPPAPKEPEEPEEEDDEGDEEPEGDDASAGGVLGGVLGGGSTQTLMGPVGVLAPIGQGGVSGIGSTGLSGGTGQGFGSGGRGPASRNGTPPPTVSLGATKVTGELPPQVIRRIVQQHLVRIRFCYEKALAKDSKLEGKVTARFVIAADGSVASVSDGGSTIKNKEVIACSLKVFQSMSFPLPANGATVVVNYPILFSPAPPPPPAASPPGPPPQPAPAPAAPPSP